MIENGDFSLSGGESQVQSELANQIVELSLSRLEELEACHRRALKELYVRQNSKPVLAAVDDAHETSEDSELENFEMKHRIDAHMDSLPRRSSSTGGVVPKIRFHSITKTNSAKFLEVSHSRDYVHLVDLSNNETTLGGQNSVATNPADADISGYNFYAWKLKMEKRPLRKLAEQPRKALGTREWRLVDEETRQKQLYERIEALKDAGVSSLYQFRRFTCPARPKAHWDYLLGEAKWLQADFRQESRWKRHIFAQLAKECAQRVSSRNRLSSAEFSEPTVVVNDINSTYWAVLPTPAAPTSPLTPSQSSAEALDLNEDSDTFQFGIPKADDQVIDEVSTLPITKTLQTPVFWKPTSLMALNNKKADLSPVWLLNTRVRSKGVVILPLELQDVLVKDNKKEKFIPEPYAHRRYVATQQRPRASTSAQVEQKLAADSGTATNNSVIHIPEWSAHEDDILFILVKHYGHSWSFISQALRYFQLRGGASQPFYWSPWQCFYRYSELLQPSKNVASSSQPAGGDNSAGGTSPVTPHVVREPFLQKMRTIEQRKRKRFMAVFELVGRLSKRRDALYQKQRPKKPNSYTGNAHQQLEILLKEKTEYRTPTELIYLREQDERRAKLQSLGQREQVLAALRQSHGFVAGANGGGVAASSHNKAPAKRTSDAVMSSAAAAAQARTPVIASGTSGVPVGGFKNPNLASVVGQQNNMPLVNQLGASIGSLKMSPKASSSAQAVKTSQNGALAYNSSSPKAPALFSGAQLASSKTIAGKSQQQQQQQQQQRMEFNQRMMWIQQIRQAVASGRMTPAQAAAMEQQLQQQAHLHAGDKGAK